MSFGIWTQVGPRNQVLVEVQIPTREWGNFEVEKGRPRTYPAISDGRYTQNDSACDRTGTGTVGADAGWGVLCQCQCQCQCKFLSRPTRMRIGSAAIALNRPR